MEDIKLISNIKYVPAVATENIYLLSFDALVLIMLRAAYLNIFLSILLSLKQDFTGNAKEYLE